MNYPLNVALAVGIGFAVANDVDEHQRLTDMGYVPALAKDADADVNEHDDAGHTVESVRAQLDAAGIAYSKKLGLAKLIALLPAG